jgi:uncharacterized protein
MSDEVLRRGVAHAFVNGGARIVFFGGEPLLEFEKIERAVTHAKALWREKGGVAPLFAVSTNGTCLEEQHLRLFHKERFVVMVSIDGCREAHEATRPLANGKSSFDRVRRNLTAALAQLSRVETVSVIDPKNAHLLGESAEWLLSLGVKRLGFSFNYMADWTEAAVSRLETGLQNLSDLYVEIYRKGSEFNLDLLDGKIRSHTHRSCGKRCAFGRGEICVAPSGQLYPCERLVGDGTRHGFAIGHIKTGLDEKKLKAIHKQKKTIPKTCLACKLNHRCTFWCGCVNFETTGHLGEPSETVCQLEQMAIQYADRAASQLYREKNTIFMRKFYS